jgi:hypothetical protein
MDTEMVADITPDVGPEAHAARSCGVCRRSLRGKQQSACSAVCRAKASRQRNARRSVDGGGVPA